DDEVGFFGTTDRRQQPPGVTFEKNKVFGCHGQAEYCLQDDQPGGPSLQLLEPGKRTKELWVLYRLDDVGLALHSALKADSYRSQRLQSFKNNDLDEIFDRSQRKSVTDAETVLSGGKYRVVTDVTDKRPGAAPHLFISYS